MGKLVVLKFGEGSVAQGFPVTLQIGEEQNSSASQDLSQGFVYRPVAEVSGKLPPAPELLQYYRHWQSTYRRLGNRTRLEAPTAQITNVSVISDCQSAAHALDDRFNHWLRSEPFRPIREKWLEQLSPTETIRLILQTDDPLVQRLPWHSWELSDRYTHSEVALSLPTYEHIPTLPPQKAKLKILALLGNSEGIDVQADRRLLEQLPNAEVVFLVEPARQQLTEQLWAQPWDILFFAGHSSSGECGSAAGGNRQWLTNDSPNATADLQKLSPTVPLPLLPSETGQLFINTTDSITISQLRYGLRKAVERGLKLAIFNSCDGLGLARNLADLQIPQMIVMREPVPDQVAQAFLKAFLAAFSAGEPLYQAVRQAREQLQGLEDQFPCATWLPIICQNPAEMPPTWAGLLGRELLGAPPATRALPKIGSAPRFQRLRQATQVLATSILVTAAVMGGRYAGWLEPAELRAFDQLMSIRPAELADPRILIVTLNQAERAKYGQDTPVGRVSLSDRYLNQLLMQLNQYQPRAIGLDLYRDFAAAPEMAQQFRQNPRLVSVCKARFLGDDSIAPPPDAVEKRVGFSDFSTDSGDVLRRHLLAMTTDLIDADAPCTTPLSFNLRLVVQYLQAQGISLTGNPDSRLQFGQTVLSRLRPRTSGYQPADAKGYQLLLNYRATPNIAAQIPLTEVLSGRLNPSAVKNRVVLIGRTDDPNDLWVTPIDSQMPGVIAHAHMISQLLSAVLDERALLWVWSPWQEAIWIGGWTLAGGLLVEICRSPRRLGTAIACLSSLLYGICWLVLTHSGWIPLIPALAGLLLAAAVAIWTHRSVRFPHS